MVAIISNSRRPWVTTCLERFAPDFAFDEGHIPCGWLLVAVAAGEFLSIAYQKYTHLDAGSYGMFWTRREWLWTHIGGGLLTIVLGRSASISAMASTTATTVIGRTAATAVF